MRNIEKAKPANSTAKSTYLLVIRRMHPLLTDHPSQSPSLAPSETARSSTTRTVSLSPPLLSLSALSTLTLQHHADGGPNGFEKTYQQCVQYSEGLLKEMGYGSADGGGKL